MNRFLTLGAISVLLLWATAVDAASNAFVRVSPRDTRYFELTSGEPYIPNGLNLIHPSTNDAAGLARMEQWMEKLSLNGGNYARIWLSSPFWDVERELSGVFDDERAKRIDALVAMARKHGIRLKLTVEHFREMSDQPRQRWANKPLHLVRNGGAATNMTDFFSGAASRERFKGKLEWYAKRYGNDPIIFGWELWNEVNAVTTTEQHYMPWTEAMLAELHRLFPRNLAMQSLGSFDTERVRPLYRRHSLLAGNDVAQVHRYLDLGASLEICRGPVDVLAADATRELLGYNPGRPVVLAESGAVEPKHTGPFKLYAQDTNGIILHDVLFAPFFSGAAGAGQIWHWDHYVDRNDLWRHFARFAEAIKDVDPAAERFEATELKHARLRVYVLKGKRKTLAWCRDIENTWISELREGNAPQTLRDLKLELGTIAPGRTSLRAFDPWANRWTELSATQGSVTLPPFSRSIVLRSER